MFDVCDDGTVTFANDMTVFLVSELFVNKAITITAQSQGDTLDITISGSDVTNHFVVNSAGDLTLDSLTLTEGHKNNAGSLDVLGRLTVKNSTLVNNRADTHGGAIVVAASGTVTIVDSELRDNTAIRSSGVLTIERSILAGNSAGNGGAIHNIFDTLMVRNSTISDNSALASGGGIQNQGTLEIDSSELSNNSATRGGALDNFGTTTIRSSTLSGNMSTGPQSNGGGSAVFSHPGSTLTLLNSTLSDNGYDSALDNPGIRSAVAMLQTTLTLGNTIIANSTNGRDCFAVSSMLNDSGHNLIEDSTVACGLVNGSNGNITGQDPALGPLTDNGGLSTGPSSGSGGASGGAGPTLTHALLANSPAIDAAKNALCPATDQRGAARPGSSTADCDIGAFEAQDVIGACTATPDDGATLFSASDARAIERAIAALAPAADTVKLAGVCAGVSNTAGTVQTVYISRTLTLEGGYTTTNWTTPTAVNTLLDAQCDGVPGRVILINGEIDVTVRNMDITCGDARGLGASGFSIDGGLGRGWASTT